MRTMFVWRSAMTLPTVIVATDSTQKRGCQMSIPSGKATNTSVINATKPAALDATDRNAVIGVGAPSYVSGAHWWNGTADTLKPKPTMTNTTASAVAAVTPLSWIDCPMPDSSVVPASP